MHEQYVEPLPAPARLSVPAKPEAVPAGTVRTTGWDRADRIVILCTVLIAQLSWLAILGYLAFRYI